MAYERTANPQATFGPSDGTGRDWNEYFRDVKGRTTAVAVDNDDDADLLESFSAVTVTIPGHEITQDWPRTINTWRNRLLANSWTVKVGYSQAAWVDQYFKSGGLKKTAHTEEQYWINAVKGDEYLTISYNYDDGKGNSTRTVRKARSIGHQLTDAELQELVKA